MRTAAKKNHLVLLPLIFLPLLFLWAGDITVTLFNNDDLYLKIIASGEFTGCPDAHLVHIGILTGLLFKGLYTLVPSVPWFGLLLFAYGYLAIYISLYLISCKIKKTVPGVFFFLFWSLVSFAFMWLHLVQLQYTTITALVCAASIVSFYLSEDAQTSREYLKNNILSVLFFFLAIELRDKAAIMFLPTFAFIGLAKCIRDRKLFKPVLAYGATILSIVIVAFGVERIAYSEENLASFEAYNTARENIVDYQGFPDYETHRSDYEALGISYDSYLTMVTRYHLLLDENIDTDFMLEMEALSGSHTFQPGQMWTSFLNRHIGDYMDRPLNLIVYILYFFTVLLLLFSKQRKGLWDVAALFSGRMVIWFYLLYINRPEARVTQGVYMAEFLILLGIITHYDLCLLNKDKKIKFGLRGMWTRIKKAKQLPQRIVLLLFCATTVFTSVKWGLPHIDMIIRYSRERAYFSCAYREIRTYFYENADNLYLADTNTFSYFTEDAFVSTIPSRANFVLLGSWTANSPWSQSIADAHGITSYERDALVRDDVYFVFLKGDATDYHYMEQYYQSKYPNTYFELCDTVYTSNGLEFHIMQVKQK